MGSDKFELPMRLSSWTILNDKRWTVSVQHDSTTSTGNCNVFMQSRLSIRTVSRIFQSSIFSMFSTSPEHTSAKFGCLFLFKREKAQ